MTPRSVTVGSFLAVFLGLMVFSAAREWKGDSSVQLELNAQTWTDGFTAVTCSGGVPVCPQSVSSRPQYACIDRLLSGTYTPVNASQITCAGTTAVCPQGGTYVAYCSDERVDVKLNGQDGGVTVPAGTRVTVHWTSNGFDGCDTGNSPAPWGPFVSKPTSGSETITVTQNMTLGLQCKKNTGNMIIQDNTSFVIVTGTNTSSLQTAAAPPTASSSVGVINCPKDVQACPDGSFVGRLPPLCNFAPCSGGSSSSALSGMCLPVCGDGIVDAGEECDDGNTNNNDSCSRICVRNLNVSSSSVRAGSSSLSSVGHSISSSQGSSSVAASQRSASSASSTGVGSCQLNPPPPGCTANVLASIPLYKTCSTITVAGVQKYYCNAFTHQLPVNTANSIRGSYIFDGTTDNGFGQAGRHCGVATVTTYLDQGLMRTFVDNLTDSSVIDDRTFFSRILSPGNHTIGLEAEIDLAGCNRTAPRDWKATVRFEELICGQQASNSSSVQCPAGYAAFADGNTPGCAVQDPFCANEQRGQSFTGSNNCRFTCILCPADSCEVNGVCQSNETAQSCPQDCAPALSSSSASAVTGCPAGYFAYYNGGAPGCPVADPGCPGVLAGPTYQGTFCQMACYQCPAAGAAVASCGDGKCTAAEVTSCPADCVAPSTCNNGVCDADESSYNCAVDCPRCGDGMCNGTETAASCVNDCSCTDSDGFEDIATKGVVDDASPQVPLADACVGVLSASVSVREFRCSGSSNAWNDLLCPAGKSCVNGACTGPQIVSPDSRCQDSDNGFVPGAYGVTQTTKYPTSNNKSDTCLWGNAFVTEYYCDSYGDIRYATMRCPAGTVCRSGACKP